jgi:hypothetical protein
MLVVDDEATVVDLHSGGLEAQVLGVGDPSHSRQDVLHVERLVLALRVLEGDRHAVVLHLRLLEAGAGVDVHAALLEGALHELGDLGVLEREDPVEGLDDGDLRAVGRVDVGELHADGAGPDDEQRLGRLLLHERARGRPDPLLVDLQDRAGHAGAIPWR